MADYKVANLAMSSAPTTIQVGSLDISYSLQVTFALRWFRLKSLRNVLLKILSKLNYL